MKIWVLTDNRIGSNNQSLSLAEQINRKFTEKKIVYNSWIRLPNFIRQSTLWGVDVGKSSKMNKGYPDVLICAGRRLSSVALYIKKKSKGKTFVINIMKPNLNFKKFDLLVIPQHDALKKNYANIVESIGCLNKVKKDRIKSETKKWKKEFSKLPRPLIGFSIGGDSKTRKFDPELFGKITKALSKITKKLGGSLLITTSRRTSSACVEALKTNLDCKNYFYDWGDENSKPKDKKNPLGSPYFAYMGASDFIVVTGDSMSMVSESCSTGKPVYIFAPEDNVGKKHLRFCKKLVKDGFAKFLTTKTSKFDKFKYKPLNEAKRISRLIKKKLADKK